MIKQPTFVIGGVGGSGTRVIAEILSKAGFFIGPELNASLDNLMFTRLFKNVSLYSKNDKYFLYELLYIFTKYMNGISIMGNELEQLQNVVNENETISFKQSKLPILDKFKLENGWGWKEPNTIVFMDELLDYYPKMKFIILIRDGCYMLNSKNQQQFNNWNDSLFDHKRRILKIRNRADFWINSYERVFNLAKDYNERVLFINYDKFCKSPSSRLIQLFRFLKYSVPSNFEELKGIPKIKTSSDWRYKLTKMLLTKEQRIKIDYFNNLN